MKKIKGHSTTATTEKRQSKRLTGACVKALQSFVFSFTMSKNMSLVLNPLLLSVQ